MIITNRTTFLQFIKNQRNRLKEDLGIKLKTVDLIFNCETKIKYKRGKWLYRCVGEFDGDNDNRITFDYDYWDYHKKKWNELIIEWERWTEKEVEIELIEGY